MLDRLFEWYRVVTARPKDETIKSREKTINDFVARLKEDVNHALLLECAVAVVKGLESGFTRKSSLVSGLVEDIRKYQPAFPQDLSENALDLRVCCAVSIGELINQWSKSKIKSGLVAASVIVSGLSLRAPDKKMHLRNSLNDLLGLASSVLEAAGERARHRVRIPGAKLDNVEPGDDHTKAVENLLTPVRSCFKEVDKQFTIDREELNVLWWMFAGYSHAARKPLTSLGVGAAALSCGGELGDLAMVPPVEGVRQMVRRATEKDRSESELAAQPLTKYAVEWGEDLVALLVPSDEASQGLAQGYPVLFPMAWLCRRLRDSRGTTSWANEFARITSIRSSYKLSPGDWAVQAFNERIAQRVYSNSLRG